MAAAQASIAVPDSRKIVTSNRSQKIALRAENKTGPNVIEMDEDIFSA